MSEQLNAVMVFGAVVEGCTVGAAKVVRYNSKIATTYLYLM